MGGSGTKKSLDKLGKWEDEEGGACLHSCENGQTSIRHAAKCGGNAYIKTYRQETLDSRNDVELTMSQLTSHKEQRL